MSVQYKEVTSIIQQQYESEVAFLNEYETGNYSFEAPYVKLNPYLIAPLTALILFKTEEPTQVKVIVKGKTKDGDMMYRPTSDTKNHVIPVYGLYADYENTVELYLTSGECSVVKIQTADAGVKLHKPTKIETTPEYMEDNCVFVTPTSPSYTAAYDYAGECRWYSEVNFAFDLKRVRNGRLLIGTDRLVAPPYHTSGVYEMGMIGKIYKEYRIPGGYHHDEIEMEDGNLLILTQILQRGTVEDYCVLVDRNTGEIIREYDHQDVLPVHPVGGSGSQDGHDWFHNNAVWYDKKTNSLSFSGRHQDIIINRDYETGKLNWIVGDPTGWPEDMQKYFFKPVGDVENFDWQYEQHACLITPSGDVMCFDNGHWRSKIKEEYVPAKDNFSRGVRYRIDTEKMEIEQVWQYGKERGAEFFSTYICNVEYYGEGHYMVHSGGTGTLHGEACNAPATMHVGTENEQYTVLNSITCEIKDDVMMYEMQLPGNYYRAEKLKLYDANDVVTFGKGEKLGTLGVTEEFMTELPGEESGIVPDEFSVRIAQEDDRMVIKARFEKGTVVMLNLEGEDGSVHRYFVPTTKRPFLAMCVGTFVDNDARAVEYPISKEGIPAGSYKVTLTIEDKKYDTDVIITV